MTQACTVWKQVSISLKWNGKANDLTERGMMMRLKLISLNVNIKYY